MPTEFELHWWFTYPIAVIVGMVVIAAIGRMRPGAGQRTAIVLVLAASLVYLVWRIGFTVPTSSVAATVAGVVLLAAEVVGVVQSVLFYVLLWKPYRDRPVPLDRLDRIPSVDVFIATYNEPVQTLRLTVAGAAGLRYPGEVNVYLCDDGSRQEVRALADEFGVGYIARTEHPHAKAGNLNHALSVTDGELVVTLDADMIPRANFLEHTVGRFHDPKLAFVQAPQAFFNEDPFQYNLFSGGRLPNEQDYFMRVLQAAKARFNAVMYVGSNTVFRREALDAVGGFATGVITEDMATGMLVQAKGYRSDFVPDVIAAGLAPENLADLLRQRDRWARGNIQAAKRWNPLRLPGLRFMQRWIYADGVLYWFFGVQKLIYVLAPLVFLTLGVPILDAGLVELSIFWAPFFVASMLSFAIVAQGRRSAIWSHVYELAMAPALAVSALSESLGLRVSRFAVTPKGALQHNRVFHWRIALPHLVLITATVFGIVNVTLIAPERFPFEMVMIAVFWALYNLVGLVTAVLLCIERPRVRTAERVESDLPLTAELLLRGDRTRRVHGRMLDLSVSGARVLLPWAPGFDREEQLESGLVIRSLRVPGIGEVTGDARWVRGTDEGLVLGFAFHPLDAGQLVSAVGMLTELPGWVRGAYEQGASVFGSAGRTIAGSARRARAHARRELRLATRSAGTVQRLAVQLGEASDPSEFVEAQASESVVARSGPVTLQDATTAEATHAHPTSRRHLARARAAQLLVEHGEPSAATVLDLSRGGCRVQTRMPLESGMLVRLDLPELLNSAELGEIRWTRRRLGGFEAGVRFARAEEVPS